MKTRHQGGAGTFQKPPLKLLVPILEAFGGAGASACRRASARLVRFRRERVPCTRPDSRNVNAGPKAGGRRKPLPHLKTTASGQTEFASAGTCSESVRMTRSR